MAVVLVDLSLDIILNGLRWYMSSIVCFVSQEDNRFDLNGCNCAWIFKNAGQELTFMLLLRDHYTGYLLLETRAKASFLNV